MAGVNKVIILGRLGNDPDVRTMPNGDSVAKISLATSESWTDKQSGEKKELTEWHNVIAFRKLAEIMGQYLKKGAQVYIEGRLRTRKWQDQNGTDRYTTEIIADNMQMLGSVQSNNNRVQDKPVQPKAAKPKVDPLSAQAEMMDAGGFDDDIPF